jgi:hypothetical protein
MRSVRCLALATAILATTCASAAARSVDGPAHLDQIDSTLQALSQDQPGAAADARRDGLTVSRAERALVDVYVSGDVELAAERLRSVGMSVAAVADDPYGVVEGWLPAASLADAARLERTDAVMAVVGGGVDIGAVTSEGDAPHRANVVRAGGVTGSGIDVGVISDSIDQVGAGVAGSQATGDLPPAPRVVVLADDAGASDEGRAMAEIIYDMATGLNRILFSTGTASGSVGKADSIDALVANGADLIADDIFYLSEPFFQDGVVAQAVDAAKANNVAYLASAGNRERQSYEATYVPDGGAAPDMHNFGGGDTRQALFSGVGAGRFVQVALHWDEPVGAVTTDIDLRIVDNATGTVLAQSLSDNIATGIPREIATVQNAGAATTLGIEIDRFAGARTPFMKYIFFDNVPGIQSPAEFDTNSDTINPDAASAQGSLAVAAVQWSEPGNNDPEPFSSRGLKTRFFNASGTRFATPQVLQKPQLAAADGVMTTVPGFQPFFGTSAATPSAAGVATLLRSANPNASVNEVYTQMTDGANAIDCTLAGNPDADCGAGFILADRAVAALDRTGPAVSGSRNPPRPNGKAGWYRRGRVRVSFTVTDPESPIESAVGCGVTNVATNGIRRVTCRATSGGGTTTLRITVKRDTKKPNKPKIRGIKPRRIDQSDLPPARRIKCKSRDAHSRLKSCKVKGYKRTLGRHKLKAVATDKAGNKRTSTLTYTVTP